MPIYEYACPDCGHEFEEMQKFTDDPMRECPACHAGNVKKLISRTNFVLAGGGWYKDHYGLKSPSDAGSSGKEGAEKGGAEKGGADAAPNSSGAPAAATPAGSSTPAAPSAAPAPSAPTAPSAPSAPSTPSK